MNRTFAALTKLLAAQVGRADIGPDECLLLSLLYTVLGAAEEGELPDLARAISRFRADRLAALAATRDLPNQFRPS